MENKIEQELLAVKSKLNELEILLSEIKKNTIKTNRYFFWTLVISILVVVLPLIIMVSTLPKLIGSFMGTFPTDF